MRSNAIAVTAASAVLAAFLWAGVAAANADVTQATSATAAPVPSGYVIHDRDVLQVQVSNDPTLSQTVTVLPGGDISYPLVGKIHVGGQTPDQASKTIAAALKTYVRHPFVSVIVTQVGTLNVLVLGNVKTPGKYALLPNARLTDAIAAAGGMGPTNGPLPDARIAMGGSTSAVTVPLEKLLRDGDTSVDAPLSDQSVVFVPAPVTIAIEVTGAVDHPGEIDLNEGDRLSKAIAMAGNSGSADSDLNNIHITRPTENGKTQDFNVNLYQTLQQGDVSKDIVMQKGDVVFVPKAKHGLAQSGSGSGSPFYLLFLALKGLVPKI